MSIIEEGERRNVRMAHLAMVGSHSVNGVAALHSELVKTTLAPDFDQLWPERFNNKTNGVTPRRWLLHANRPLAALITQRHRRRLDHATSTSCGASSSFADDVGVARAVSTRSSAATRSRWPR